VRWRRQRLCSEQERHSEEGGKSDKRHAARSLGVE
jgi:hypothetical protein